MRRLVAIHVKGGVAVSLWVLGALCVGAEVRQPGFWYDKVGRLADKSGDLNHGTNNAATEQRSREAAQASDQSSPEPAYQDAHQNNEVAAEQQAAEIPPQEGPKQDSHVRQLVISIPDRRLALLVDGELVKIYRVAVGKDETPSPEGEFTIVNHAVKPTYRHGDTEIGPGKDNPLGTRWIGLSLKGYGIHGTNVQSSVGKAASHGCFRMKKKDVEDLYGRVQVGDAVSIRGERDESTAGLFGTPVAPATHSEASKTTEVAAVNAQVVAGNGQ